MSQSAFRFDRSFLSNVQGCREDVADYANVFEFGDQGGLLVMARHQTQGPTDHIHFSMDEGQCWHRINLSEAINVVNIRSALASELSSSAFVAGRLFAFCFTLPENEKTFMLHVEMMHQPSQRGCNAVECISVVRLALLA